MEVFYVIIYAKLYSQYEEGTFTYAQNYTQAVLLF